MLKMLVKVFTEDKNIVNINQGNFPIQVSKNLSHQGLERNRCIHQTEGEARKLVYALMSNKSTLIGRGGVQGQLPKSTLEVKHSENLCFCICYDVENIRTMGRGNDMGSVTLFKPR